MSEIPQGEERQIFTESIYGASVGVKLKDKHLVHIHFSKFPSYINTGGRRGVANLELFKDVEEDISVILRVFINQDEMEKPDINVYAYKEVKGEYDWRALNKVEGREKIEIDHIYWRAYVEVYLEAGDPPIAVG